MIILLKLVFICHLNPFLFLATLPMLCYQDVRRGLNSIRRICREYKISGVFGPIIELLDCDEKYFTAVEVTAGNRYVNSILLCSMFSLLELCSQSA